MSHKLLSYSWPGNIRELENIIERSIIVSRGNFLTLPELEPSKEEVISTQKIEGDLKSIEKTAIENALLKTNGNRKKAAEILGISLRSLQYKIKEYGLWNAIFAYISANIVQRHYFSGKSY